MLEGTGSHTHQTAWLRLLFLPKVRHHAWAAPTMDAHLRPVYEAFGGFFHSFKKMKLSSGEKGIETYLCIFVFFKGAEVGLHRLGIMDVYYICGREETTTQTEGGEEAAPPQRSSGGREHHHPTRGGGGKLRHSEGGGKAAPPTKRKKGKGQSNISPQVTQLIWVVLRSPPLLGRWCFGTTKALG